MTRAGWVLRAWRSYDLIILSQLNATTVRYVPPRFFSHPPTPTQSPAHLFTRAS